MSDDLDPTDPIVGFLRATDPGDPPVTLGPGSSLRHRAAVRHARRQAVGAVLAVGLIGVAVVGSVVGTRHHANVTTATHGPIASVSAGPAAGTSRTPPSSAIVGQPTGRPTEIVSAPTPTLTTSETARPNKQSASPSVPTLGSASFRNPGEISVGQSVYFTVHYTAQGSYTPGWTSVDYGDGNVVASESSCPATTVAPTSVGSGGLSGEISTPSHTYTAPGTYDVRVTIGFACIAGSDATVVDRTIVVTGPSPVTTSASPSASVSASPSPSASPSAPGPGSATPTP